MIWSRNIPILLPNDVFFNILCSGKYHCIAIELFRRRSWRLESAQVVSCCVFEIAKRWRQWMKGNFQFFCYWPCTSLHLLLAAALPSTANLQSLISIDLLSGSNAFQSILTILTNVIIRYLECSNFYCKMLLEKKFWMKSLTYLTNWQTDWREGVQKHTEQKTS